MKIRKYNTNDYEPIVSFWKSYEWPNIPPQDALPSDGFICEDETGRIMSACFLYLTSNAPWAVLTWCVTNREFDKNDRLDALDKVVDHATKYAVNEKSVKYIHSFNSQGAIISALENAGFEKCEKDCTVMTYGAKIDFMKDDFYFPLEGVK